MQFASWTFSVLMAFSFMMTVVPTVLGHPFVVVSHPFKGAGSKANDFEVLEWKNSSIIKTGFHFHMKTVNNGEMVFINNGRIGVVAQDDGSVGVVSLAAANGKPTVLSASLNMSSCDASSVVADPRNASRVFVLDEDRDGAICLLGVSATGELVNEGLWMRAGGPITLLFSALSDFSSAALLVSMDGTVSLLDLATKTIVTSVVAFPDQDALVSGAALTADAKHLIVLDDNIVTGKTRIGVVAIDISSHVLKAVQLIEDVVDPASVVCSPFNNAVVVASSQGNALLLFTYDAHNATHPLASKGPIAPLGKAPQLPQTMVNMAGPAAVVGRVFVAELSGVRQVPSGPYPACLPCVLSSGMRLGN